MKLCKEFIIKDILEYEIQNDMNIINELTNLNLDVVIDLLMIGNKILFEEACEILDRELENRELTDIIKQLFEEIIGRVPENNEPTMKSNEVDSLSDVLSKFYNEIQTLDEKLDINTFWNMSTSFMYKYGDGVKERYIYNTNKQLRDNYTSIGMFMSAFAGKLKKCPQIEENGEKKEQSLIDKLKAMSNRGGA